MKATARAIADNRSAKLSPGWDNAVLSQLLGSIKASGEVPMAATGFTDEQLQALLSPVESPGTDQSAQLIENYNVLVECGSEAEQLAFLEKMIAEGRKCRALTV